MQIIIFCLSSVTILMHEKKRAKNEIDRHVIKVMTSLRDEKKKRKKRKKNEMTST